MSVIDEPVQEPAAANPAIPDEVRAAARAVCNWGRWGPDDELGTLNYITPAMVAKAAGLVRRGVRFSLSVPFEDDGPQGAHGFRRNPIHLMSVDGGDTDMAAKLGDWGGTKAQSVGRMSSSPARINDDYIMMPLQAATQWDALAHVYYDDRLYNGFDAKTVTSFGARRNGIDKVAAAAGIVGRGVLLDVARFRGVDRLDEHAVITPDELEQTASAQGVEVGEGDILLVRTGWWSRFVETGDGDSWGWPRPGLAWRCAPWLHERKVAAVACDNSGVEASADQPPGAKLAFHMLAIRDMGMMLGEIWDLEALGADCAQDGVYEFMVIAAPLLITGAVGSPINPIAIK